MSDRAVLRRRAALTQAQLARLTGISAPRICLWERDEIQLKREQVERIAVVLRDRLAESPVFESLEELLEKLAWRTVVQPPDRGASAA
jgi:transcriptional regulator with XRE-family HTH domain